MGMDITWMSQAGLDTKTGISYTGSQDKYVSAVQRYFNNYEKNRTKIDEYFAAKDYENFMITVHALKSNSRMIGATELSEQFETLEAAARSGDTEIIEEVTPAVVKDYAALVEKLSPIKEVGDLRAADEISAETALKIAGELVEALDDFEDDKAKRLAIKLTGYPFRITQANRLKEAIAYIDDFLYDEATAIIREISAQIE